MDSDLNIANNADTDSKSSETHQNGNSLYSRAEMNGQFARLHAEMNENKGLLSTLTQQFTSRLEEGNALRGSSSRNPERIDMVTGVSRTTHAAPMTRNIQDYRDDEYEGPMRTPTESVDTNQLLTTIHEIPRLIQTSSTNTKLLQTLVPNF